MNEPEISWPRRRHRRSIRAAPDRPLARSAVRLAVQDAGVDRAANVVDGDIARDLHRPEIGVDLDLATWLP